MSSAGVSRCTRRITNKSSSAMLATVAPPFMTIFGYNTDVKHADVVYHVQSEARQSDLLLQTLIYVKGQCVGKHTFSYAEKILERDFSEAAMHELLKEQHRGVVERLQQGRLDSVLLLRGEIFDVGGSSIALQWSNPHEPAQGERRKMRFQVLQDGQSAPGAELVVRSAQPGEPVALATMRSDSSGQAEFELNLAHLSEPAVIVSATRAGKSATRKFRFRK